MSLIKQHLFTQMSNELFDPGIDNLSMPVDGIEPDLEMLTQREQLMEDIDTICDEFFFANYDGDLSVAEDFVRMLCDAVVRNFPTK